MMATLNEKRIFFQSLFDTHMDVPSDMIQNINVLKNLPSNIISNVGGWQSQTYFNDQLDWMNPHIEHMKKAVDRIFDLYGMEKKCNEVGYWFNINNKDSYNKAHKHNNSVISAVWYIKVPPNSGEIVFERSDDEVIDWLAFANGGNPEKITHHSNYAWGEVPQEGSCLLFPSWIRHRVEPNNTNEDRISIAFNFGVKHV